MKRFTNYIWAALVLAALSLPVAYAQQQAPPPTTPPASGAGSQGAPPQQEPASPVVGMPVTVTGGLAPNVGDSGDVHSQITAGLQYSELFDSNFADSAGGVGWDEISTIGGHFDLTRNGAGRAFTMSYSGGGYIDPRNSGNDSTYHALTVTEAFQFRRWTLSLVDSFSYLPQSSFGFAGAGGSGSPFLNITLLNPDVLPGQGIQSGPANRFSNTAFAQVSYAASQRSAWTFGGSYGLLHFTNSGFLNSMEYDFSAGYNYLITSKDTIGVSYQFDATRFSPALASITNHTISFNYGHHISRQLALQVGAGPQLNNYVPVTGPSLGLHVQWSASAGLSYLYGRTSTSVSFSHGVTGGAGILVGANTDTVSVGASHPIGRYSSISGSFGVSQNSSLPQVSGPGSSYTSEYATVGYNRGLGTQASVFANYSLIHQSTNVGPCLTAVCGPQFTRHQIFVGVSWNMRPVPLR
jgi:hypothetical protein